ncbi:MAG: ribonuclease III [Bacteroidia bacterium]|nr:ribonuclease III [Bacteroidia bacterium]
MIKTIFSSDKKLYSSLKNLLGFYPGNINLYKQAFRHSSVAKEVKAGFRDSNERLEFLGDAVLGGIIAEYLFRIFPYKDEGFLTKLRSRMVSRAQHNQIARKLGLEKLIESNIDGGRPGSVLGDCYEALIGAVYLDKGYEKTRRFVLSRIVKVHLDVEHLEQNDTDFKSRIIEYVQREKLTVEFRLNGEVGKGSDKQFVIHLVIGGELRGEGRHFSKKGAEQLAAEKACSLLGISS